MVSSGMVAEIEEGAEEVTTRDKYGRLSPLVWRQDSKICQGPEGLPFPVHSDLRKAESIPPFSVPSRWLEQSDLALTKISKVDLEHVVLWSVPFPMPGLFPLIPQLFPRTQQPAEAENCLKAGAQYMALKLYETHLVG